MSKVPGYAYTLLHQCPHDKKTPPVRSLPVGINDTQRGFLIRVTCFIVLSVVFTRTVQHANLTPCSDISLNQSESLLAEDKLAIIFRLGLVIPCFITFRLIPIPASGPPGGKESRSIDPVLPSPNINISTAGLLLTRLKRAYLHASAWASPLIAQRRYSSCITQTLAT